MFSKQKCDRETGHGPKFNQFERLEMSHFVLLRKCCLLSPHLGTVTTWNVLLEFANINARQKNVLFWTNLSLSELIKSQKSNIEKVKSKLLKKDESEMYDSAVIFLGLVCKTVRQG